MWWEVMKHKEAISKACVTWVSFNKIAKQMFFQGSVFPNTDTLLPLQLAQVFSQEVDFLLN